MSKQGSKRERMGAVLAGWRKSGESAAEFCRRHGIKPQKLSYWKRVLGAEATPVRRRRPKGTFSLGSGASGFAPVRLLGLAGGGSELELQLSSGERLLLRPGVSAELLREVLGALRERC